MTKILPLLRRLALFGTCLGASLVATWPLVGSLSSALPLGTENEATVPLLNTWSLWWTADRLPHGLTGFWTAPIFHPLEGTFAFSEPLFLQGVALSPLWWLGAPPAAIYNLALLLTLALNGLATAALVRQLGSTRQAQFLAAIGGVLLPYSAKVLGVLPVLPLFGALWALAGLVRFGKEGGWHPAAVAVAGFAIQFLAAQQMALLCLPFVLAAGGVALFEQRFRLRAIATLAGIGALGAIALLPMILPVSRIHEKYGFTRSEETVRALSARPADFATRPSTARVPFPPLESSTAGDTGGLFPGALVSGLALVGAILAWRARQRRAWIAFLAGSVVVGGLLALGLHLEIAGWQPFETLRQIVPGLRTLRSPFRAAAVAQALLPVLAALALARLAAWKRPTGPVLAVALGLLAAAENLASPGPLSPTPSTAKSDWTEWLRAQPGRLIVAQVPFPEGLHVSDYERDARRMFAQTWHRRPLINGYSGYFPSGYGMFQADIDTSFPSERLLCMMSLNLGVNTLVVDKSWFEVRRSGFESPEVRQFLTPAFSGDGILIFRVNPPFTACQGPSGA